MSASAADGGGSSSPSASSPNITSVAATTVTGAVSPAVPLTTTNAHLSNRALPRVRPTNESREQRSLARAEAMVAAGEIDRALDHLRRLVAAVPDSVRGCLRMATLLRERNRPGEALDVLRRAVARSPKSVPSREMLAELCLEAGHWEEAVAQCRELLQVSPRSLLARDVLSAAYLQRGLLEKALRVIDEMVRLDPHDAGSHFKRGVLLQQIGNISGAVYAFQRALDMAPDSEAGDESRAALEMLDSYQIRQVITLAVEDLGFRIQLRRDPGGAVAGKGYTLSETGLHALMQMRFDDLPEAPPGWRHHFYH